MDLRRILVIVLVAVFVLSIFAASVAAGEAAAPPAKRISMLQVLAAAGVVGWIIILLSVGATALIIEHAINIRRDIIVPPELLGTLETLFEDEEYEEAMTLCEASPGFITNIVAAGLPKIGQGYEALTEAMQ